jgi:hypothetical protein
MDRMFIPPLFPDLLWLNDLHVELLLSVETPLIPYLVAGYNHPVSLQKILQQRPVVLSRTQLGLLDSNLRESTAHARWPKQLRDYFLTLLPTVPFEFTDVFSQICEQYKITLNYHEIVYNRCTS